MKFSKEIQNGEKKSPKNLIKWPDKNFFQKFLWYF